MKTKRIIQKHAAEAKVDLKAYRENQPEYAVKIVKRRVKIEN